jgi:hypothetical protein
MPIGARGTAEETVEFKHTLTFHHPELPPVYSTRDMIRLMETAAFYALQPYCEADEITVGTTIRIERRAASGIGAPRFALKPCLNLLTAALIPCELRRGMMSRRSAGTPSAELW